METCCTCTSNQTQRATTLTVNTDDYQGSTDDSQGYTDGGPGAGEEDTLSDNKITPERVTRGTTKRKVATEEAITKGSKK